MGQQKLYAVVFPPGGEVQVSRWGESIEKTNTGKRCRFAVQKVRDLQPSYQELIYITSGTTDHPGQTIPTGVLAADYIRSQPRYNGEKIYADTNAWDTITNLEGLQKILTDIGWWPKNELPLCDFYFISEYNHCRRMERVMNREYGVEVITQYTDDTLPLTELRQEKIFYALSYFKPGRRLLAFLAKTKRERDRRMHENKA